MRAGADDRAVDLGADHQGIGGALLTPGSLAIIQAAFRREDRARAIGAWAALGGIGAAIGPLLGGYLIEAISWRAIFLLNLPLAAFVIAASAKHVPESSDPDAKELDYLGAALAVIGLGGLTYGLIGAPEGGVTSPVVLVTLVIGVAGLAAFLAVERTSSHPMIELSAFANRQFSAANALTFIVYGALGGVFFLFVVFLQTGLGYSPLEAGAASLPITFLMLTLSERAGALAERIGPRVPLTVGPVMIGAGMILLGRLGPESGYLDGVLPGLVVFGLGLAAMVAPVTSTALTAADQSHAGVASGINNAVARSAGLIAVAVLPGIAGLGGDAFADPVALDAGFETAMWVTAGLAAFGGLIAFTQIRSNLLSEGAGPEVERGCGIDGPPPCWRDAPDSSIATAEPDMVRT